MKDINPYTVRIPYDKVLLKLRPLNDKVAFNGDFLTIDTAYFPADHANVIAEVVVVPDKFSTPTMATAEKGIEWKPKLELKPGDKVIVDYHDLLTNFGRKVHKLIEFPKENYIEFKGDFYVFVNYHALYARVDGDDLYPLNGWIIYEGVINKQTFGEYSKDILSIRSGIVKYVGGCNEEYLKRPEIKVRHKDTKDQWLWDIEDIEVGEKVIFRKGLYRKLEVSLHAKFNKNLYITQRRWVLAKVEVEV